MELTTFTHKFKSGSIGSSLQKRIHTLEDNITEAEKAALTLDIGGYHVFMSASMEIETEEDRSPTGSYYDETPEVLHTIGLQKIVLKGINAQIIRWKAELVDKYSEYNKFLDKD